MKPKTFMYILYIFIYARKASSKIFLSNCTVWRNCLDNDQRLFRNILIFNKWREPGHNSDSFRLTLKCFKIPHFKCHKVQNLTELVLRNRDKSNYLDDGTIKQFRGTPSTFFRFISICDDITDMLVCDSPNYLQDASTYTNIILYKLKYWKICQAKFNQIENNILQDRRKNRNVNNHIEIWIWDVIG